MGPTKKNKNQSYQKEHLEHFMQYFYVWGFSLLVTVHQNLHSLRKLVRWILCVTYK